MPRSFRRLVLGTIGIALLAACEDSPVARGPAPARPDEPGTGATGDVLATQRLSVELSATGAFRPGTPVVVTSTARARHDAADVEYDLMVPDDDGMADARQRGLGRAVGTFRGPMGRGAERQLTATITFARPGYYRVEAIARNAPTATDPNRAADSVLIDLAANTLYVLIDEQGGKLTNGYDPSALEGRTPANGSFGPFVQGRTGAGTSQAARQVTMGAVGGRHRIVYQNLDAPKNPDGTTALTHVPAVRIVYECLNTSFTPVSKDSLLSAADGTFTIPCASGYYNASAHLRNAYSNVLWANRADAGVDKFYEYSNTDLWVSNLRAGHVHRLLHRYVPLVNQRFGASRARLTYLVNNVPSTTTISRYNAGLDEVELNHDAVFDEYGRFTIMHEYGHAYHYTAIERWAAQTPYCGGGGHTIDGQYDYNCALVEGFADFFGSWIAADSLVSDLYSDWKLETQTFYVGKDGAQVEGAFAGFLYDLVDGPSDPDAVNNAGSIDDTGFVDGVTYSASMIASTMRLCELRDATYTYKLLYASYDLIYCLEESLEPYSVVQTFGYTWYPYTGVVRYAIAPASTKTDVRRLWRANLYGR
jgi:hypothetical protein